MKVLPWICAACLFVSTAAADRGTPDLTGPAGTSVYEFEAPASTITQTGGFAGLHRTYQIEGRLVLTIDPNAGTASFDQVQALAVSEGPGGHDLDPNDVFNMTGLSGVVAEDGSLRFEGRAGDGSSVLITLVATDGTIRLRGETVPPPQSADFFVYELDAAAHRKYAGGTGEPNHPYLISTAEQMNAIGAEPNDWDRHFRLMADIDLSQYSGDRFQTIGYYTPQDQRPFTGVFDGAGHTISNFRCDSPTARYAALFNGVDGLHAEIKNLGLINAEVHAPKAKGVAALVSHLAYGTVTNCFARGGNVSGDALAGGLVGINLWGKIQDCYASVAVSGNERIGGLVGDNYEGTIVNCYATGFVAGQDGIGGLLGANSGRVTASFWDLQTSGCATSAGGDGQATIQMQTADTFRAAGWDFVGETANGTQDTWWIPAGQDYPRLAWEQIPGDNPAVEIPNALQ